jgi:hypothetical protein
MTMMVSTLTTTTKSTVVTKTTRVNCGRWHGQDLETGLATSMFGPPGTQANRSWFYRIYNDKHEWRRVGRRSCLHLVLYFRNSADATLFCLKKPQD